jgi:hypothetical protein
VREKPYFNNELVNSILELRLVRVDGEIYQYSEVEQRM